jgi:dienelactone hydrolase
MDWLAIRYAAARMPEAAGVEPHLEEASLLVNDPAFLMEETPVAQVELGEGGGFRFTSPQPCPFSECNTVHGRLYAEGDWRGQPSVILVHGWNDSPNHYYRFPSLARKFARAGMTAVTLELPYHFQRRPRARLGAASNFLSADILRTARAAAQAVAEMRALARWLAEEGCPRIGLLGVSMGGWLGGLAACHEKRLDALALMAPVIRLDRLIDEAAFCQPIKRALCGKRPDFGRLNLLTSRPLLAKENILLIQARHDLFVPPETVNELSAAWGGPEMWTLGMGHVSIVGAPGLSRRLTEWFSARLVEGETRDAKHTDFSPDKSATEDGPPSRVPRASS